MKGRCTLFSSPRPLGKEWRLLPDGKLEKRTNGQMSEGEFHTVEWETAADFKGILEAVAISQALSSSLCFDADSGRVVAERALGTSPGAYARTKAHFGLKSSQPTFALIDIDCAADGKTWTAESARDWLVNLVPGLASAGMVVYASGSSEIWEGGKQHRGLSSLHIYLFIADASDLKRFGEALFKLAWLSGHGHIHVNTNGALSPRTVFDGAVFHPARLVFSGGSICTPPLEQRRDAPTAFDGDFFDTRTVVLTDEQDGQYVALVESAKAKARPASEAAKQSWLEGRVKVELGKAIEAGEDLTEAKSRILHRLEAAHGGTLLGLFMLTVVDDQGNETELTVDEALADRNRYHLARCLSALNNDHRDRAADAILYLNQAQPVLFDLDNGGQIYRLVQQPIELAMASGNRAQVAQVIASVIAKDEDIFLVAGQIVQVMGERMFPMPMPMLAFRIGHRVSLYREGKEKKIRMDPDMPLVSMVMALLPQMLRTIVGRSTIPLITTAGRIINVPGFDDDTALFFALQPDDCHTINPSPSRQETVEALRRLWRPFSKYKWATKHDRAAVLATILTIVIRPTMLAAFGLFISATCQASGKTKATEALLGLVTGKRGGLVTWQSDNEIELGKLLLSMMLSGALGVIFDNVVRVFQSPILCSAIMSGTVTARLLGVSEDRTANARLMWLASGNGVSMDRDQADRWLVAHINVACERPGETAYDFDPVQEALSDRQGIIRACIAVHRAYHEAGRPEADNVPTRIADYGRAIRQLVLWLRDSGIAEEAGIGELGDPTFCMSSAANTVDAETESFGMFLQGLSDLFGGEHFTSSQVRAAFNRGADGVGEGERLIHEGLSGLMPNARPGNLSPQSVNAVMKNRRGRIVGGLKVETITQFGAAANRGSYWQVQPVAA